MSRLKILALAVSTLAAALAATPARAATTSALSTFTFTGQCTDCAGTATGSLVLRDYTLGQQIGDTNFVSFSYGGTNLFAPYTITAADGPSLFGSIDPTLPSAENIDISDDAVVFTSTSGGFWCTGAAFSCSLDNGPTHLWSAAAATPANPVPEPMTLGLLGGGLLGLAALRRKA